MGDTCESLRNWDFCWTSKIHKTDTGIWQDIKAWENKTNMVQIRWGHWLFNVSIVLCVFDTHPCPNFKSSLGKPPLDVGHGWIITHHIFYVEVVTYLNSSPPGQNGRYFADDVLTRRCIYVNEMFCILMRISLKFVPKSPIDINPTVV